MKTSLKPAKIDRIGDFNETKFGIKNNEDLVYIFDILRNKLYTNKVAAIVREYSTNAFDAHVDAGIKEKPIRITAPSTLTPSISIRDFGEGLSEKDIREVYCMYGRSTKRNSNEFTGQLGLGCKSAFSYSESFTIVSRYNGEEITYNAYIDESRVGSIAKMSVAPTEETGIEIIVPVKTKDITEFNREISKICRFFSVCPELVNLSLGEEEKPLIETEGWSMNDKPPVGHSHIVMGNIGYPIDLASLGIYAYSSSNRPTEDRAIHALLTSYNINIKVPVGKLNISANREGLEYDEYTKKNLKEFLVNVRKEFVEKVKNLIEDEPSAIQRICLYNKIVAGSYYKDRIFGQDFKVFLPCGTEIYRSSLDCKDVNCWFIDRNKPGKKKKSEKIVPSKKAAYIYRDIESDSYISKAFEYLENNDDINSVYVVDNICPSNTNLYPFRNDFIKSSSLPKPKKKSKTSYISAGHTIDRSNFNCYTIAGSVNRDYMTGAEAFKEVVAPKNPEDTHFYLEINRYEFGNNINADGKSVYATPFKIKTIIEFLKGFDSSFSTNFVCIKTSEIKHVIDQKNWMSLSDAIDNLAINNESFMTEIRKAVGYQSAQDGHMKSYSILLRRMGPIDNLSQESVFCKTYKYFMNAYSSTNCMKIDQGLLDLIDVHLSKEIGKIEKLYYGKNNTIVNNFLDRYPMLKFAPIHSAQKEVIDDFVKYVNVVENCSHSS